MGLASTQAQAAMKIEQLASAIEARVINQAGKRNPEVGRAYAGSTMSDLIANASPQTLLVTSLNNPQLVRVAELMDVPGICLVNGCEPAPELISHARGAGTALLVSTSGLRETLARITACLTSEEARQP